MTGESGYWFNFVQIRSSETNPDRSEALCIEERMAKAMCDEEDRSGEVAAGRIWTKLNQ